MKSWHDYAENLLITTRHAYTVFTEGDSEDKKALLKAIGESYQLKNGIITFDLKPPFNFIQNIVEVKSSSQELVLRGLDSNQQPSA